METITTNVTVRGMTCEHCVRAVHDELSALPGVTGVDVDLDAGMARIRSTGPLDPAAVVAAVDEAGYEVVP